MKVLYTRPLTTPAQAPLFAGLEQIANESDLSMEFHERFPALGTRSDFLVRLWLAYKLAVARHRYDVVVTGRYGEWFSLLQRGLPLGRRPHLLLDIEWYVTRGRTRQRSALSTWLRRRMAEGATRVQVFCHVEARNYAQAFGIDESKFVWIPYCTDAGANSPVAESGDYLLSSGFHQRDYATLFEAVKRLPVELRIAAGREQFGSLPIPPNVSILGTLTSEAYSRQIASARMVVLSLDPHVIRRPGVITYVQAMRQGKCVVVNDPAGASSYIDDGTTGFLVKPGDPADLHQTIARLLDSPRQVSSIAANARQAASERFSMAQYTLRLEQAVEDCLASS